MTRMSLIAGMALLLTGLTGAGVAARAGWLDELKKPFEEALESEKAETQQQIHDAVKGGIDEAQRRAVEGIDCSLRGDCEEEAATEESTGSGDSNDEATPEETTDSAVGSTAANEGSVSEATSEAGKPATTTQSAPPRSASASGSGAAGTPADVNSPSRADAEGSPPEGSSERLRDADIVGLKLGMSPEDVRTAIAAYDASLVINEVNEASHLGIWYDVVDASNRVAVQEELGEKAFLSLLRAESPDNYRQQGEIIAVAFSLPPSVPKAVSIVRIVRFSQDKAPSVANTKAALIEKYGDPALVHGTGFMWNSGPTAGDMQCFVNAFINTGKFPRIRLGNNLIYPSVAVNRPNQFQKTRGCERTVTAMANTYYGLPNAVSQLIVSIIDHGKAYTLSETTRTSIRDRTARAEAQKAEEIEGRAGPVLSAGEKRPQVSAAPSPSAAPTAGAESQLDGTDIVGLRLGITPDQAKAVILSREPKATVSFLEGRIENRANWWALTSMTAGNRETFALFFAPAPNEQRAYVVSRRRTFSADTRPTVDATVKGLVKKYGEPVMTDPTGAMLWFDGAVDTSPGRAHRRAFARCSVRVVHIRNASPPDPHPACGTAVLAKVSSHGDFVHSVEVALMDHAKMDEANRIAAEARAAEAQRAAEEKKREAEVRGSPEF